LTTLESPHEGAEARLLDQVAITQVTQIPTAVFITSLLEGESKATIATIGIFLPPSLFVALSRWGVNDSVLRILAAVAQDRFFGGCHLRYRMTSGW
jgi:hypothetical protein